MGLPSMGSNANMQVFRERRHVLIHGGRRRIPPLAIDTGIYPMPPICEQNGAFFLGRHFAPCFRLFSHGVGSLFRLDSHLASLGPYGQAPRLGPWDQQLGKESGARGYTKAETESIAPQRLQEAPGRQSQS